MARKTYKKVKDPSNISIHLHDAEIGRKLIEYGQRKNMNLSEVIMKLIQTKDNLDGLLTDLDREKYELLDEDEKIDRILELEKKLKEAGYAERQNQV